MTTFTNQSKNSTSYSAQSKNSTSYINESMSLSLIDYLLLETGFEILTEDNMFILLEQSGTGIQTAWNTQIITV